MAVLCQGDIINSRIFALLNIAPAMAVLCPGDFIDGRILALLNILERPPRRENRNVTKLVTISVPISDFEMLPTVRNEAGLEFRVLEFSLDMVFIGASLLWIAQIDGEMTELMTRLS